VSSGSSGQTLTSSAKSGYICAKLSKLVDKTGFVFFVSSLSTRTSDFQLRGSTYFLTLATKRAFEQPNRCVVDAKPTTAQMCSAFPPVNYFRFIIFDVLFGL